MTSNKVSMRASKPPGHGSGYRKTRVALNSAVTCSADRSAIGAADGRQTATAHAGLSALCEVQEDAWIRLVIYWSVRASTDAFTAADAMRARAATRSKPEVRPPP